MKYNILFSNQFKHSYKRCLKRGCDKFLFEEVVTILANTGTLPKKYKPHKLTGDWKGFWECHIQPDWLLIWEQTRHRINFNLNRHLNTFRFIWLIHFCHKKNNWLNLSP